MWSCRKGARRRGGPRRGSSRRQCFLPFARRGEGESHRLVSARSDRGGTALGGASIIVEAIALDRKSTRLNSSHGYISYAVFCLKKKKRPSSTPDPSHHSGL